MNLRFTPILIAVVLVFAPIASAHADLSTFNFNSVITDAQISPGYPVGAYPTILIGDQVSGTIIMLDRSTVLSASFFDNGVEFANFSPGTTGDVEFGWSIDPIGGHFAYDFFATILPIPGGPDFNMAFDLSTTSADGQPPISDFQHNTEFLGFPTDRPNVFETAQGHVVSLTGPFDQLAVPEPTIWTLLLAGCVAFFGIRCRRA